jgi:hypothetical protein
VLLHEGAVTTLIMRGHTDELIDVESVRAGEIRFAGFVQARELFVDGERRASRRQAEHRTRLAGKVRGDCAGRGVCGLFRRPEHADVHVTFGR